MAFTRLDTVRPDGVYIMFDFESVPDETASPDDDEGMTDERRAAWWGDDWHYRGIRARADILVVRGGQGVGTIHSMRSAGLWGIASDCGKTYEQEVYAQEVDDLKADIAAFAAGPTVYGPWGKASKQEKE